MIVQILRNPALVGLPKYETDGAAAMDVRAILDDTVLLRPGERVLIKTGIRCVIPKGWKINILPRSGLAYKNGVSVLNSPGLIDSDYRGDIGVIVINQGTEDFYINPLDRIAQIEIAPVYRIDWIEVESLDTTERGTKGFGSTGV